MIQPGKYQAKALDAQLGETKEGKEKITVTFSLAEHPEEVMTWTGYFSERALPITVRALRACGWTGALLNDLSGINRNVVELVVEHESYNGKTSARVQWVNALGGGRPGLEAAKAKSFAERMQGQILALDAGSPSNEPVPF